MTFLGEQTVDELRDLIAAKDYTLKQVQAARDGFQWSGSDASDWDSDWNALKVKYAAAKTLAATAFTRAGMAIGVRDSLVPAPVEYAAVLKSIRQDPAVQSKGDLQDLSDRLSAAMGHGIDFSQTPQPTAQDVDLDVFNDPTLKAISDVAPALGKAAQAASKAAKSPLAWIAGGILGLFGLGLLIRR